MSLDFAEPPRRGVRSEWPTRLEELVRSGGGRWARWPGTSKAAAMKAAEASGLAVEVRASKVEGRSWVYVRISRPDLEAPPAEPPPAPRPLPDLEQCPGCFRKFADHGELLAHVRDSGHKGRASRRAG